MTAAGRGVLTREGSRRAAGCHGTPVMLPAGDRSSAGRAETPAGGHGIRHDVRGTTSTRPPRPVGRERSTDDGDGERGERGVPRRAGLHVPHGGGRRGRPGRHGDHRHRRRRPAPRPGARRRRPGERPAVDRPRGRHRQPRRQPRRAARRPTAVPRRHPDPGAPRRARRPRRRPRGHDDHRHLAHRRRRRAARTCGPAASTGTPSSAGRAARARPTPSGCCSSGCCCRPTCGWPCSTPTPTSCTSAPRCPGCPRPMPGGSPSAACRCCAATPPAPRATSRCGCGSAR